MVNAFIFVYNSVTRRSFANITKHLFLPLVSRSSKIKEVLPIFSVLATILQVASSSLTLSYSNIVATFVLIDSINSYMGFDLTRSRKSCRKQFRCQERNFYLAAPLNRSVSRRYRDQILTANIYELRRTSRPVDSSRSAFRIQEAACSEEKAVRDWTSRKKQVSRHLDGKRRRASFATLSSPPARLISFEMERIKCS